MTAAMTRARLAGLTPEQAAALWQVQLDSGAPVEAGLFDEWLGESEANRFAWAAVEDAWGLFNYGDDPGFAAIRAAALADTGARGSGLITRHWRSAAAVAATMVAVAGGMQLVHRTRESGAVVASNATTVQRSYDIPPGAAQTFALADGTSITLDGDTRARVAFGADRRQVILDHGGALFAVTHNAARPFAVSAQGRTVVDVGTRFAMSVGDDTLRVALYEGSVRVDGGSAGAITMLPGQQMFARAGQADVVSPVGTGAEALWREGLVEFNDVTLAQAVDEINAGSMVKLVIADPSVARLRVSGRFRLRDSARFARSVAELLSLRVVQIGPDRIELRSRH